MPRSKNWQSQRCCICESMTLLLTITCLFLNKTFILHVFGKLCFSLFNGWHSQEIMNSFKCSKNAVCVLLLHVFTQHLYDMVISFCDNNHITYFWGLTSELTWGLHVNTEKDANNDMNIKEEEGERGNYVQIKCVTKLLV